MSSDPHTDEIEQLRRALQEADERARLADERARLFENAYRAAEVARQAAEVERQAAEVARQAAEQQIQSTKTTPPEEALRKHLENLKGLTMHTPTVRTQRRVGNTTVEQEIKAVFVANTTLQESKAAALIGASGVGKTFTALTYPTGAIRQEYDSAKRQHVMFYTGFNSGCDLTGDESQYLSRALMSEAANAVAVVVLGRLLACLIVGLNDKEALVRPAGRDVHRILRGVNSSALLSSPEGSMYNVLHKECVDKLVLLESMLFADQLATPSTQSRLSVLVNVDEAQILDAYIKDSTKRPQGARYALRCLRKLQVDVAVATQSRVSVLGLATGIKAKSHLKEKTEGVNVAVGGRLTEKQHFYTIARMLEGYDGAVSRNVRIAAAAAYPRVREFVLALSAPVAAVSKENHIVSFDETMKSRQIKTRIRLLIDAFVRNRPIPLRMIPAWCAHDNASQLEAIPFLDLPVWQDLTTYVVKHRPSFCFPTLRDILHEECLWQKLESASGRVLYIILMLFFQVPARSGLWEVTMTCFRNDKQSGAALAEALGIGATETLCLRENSYIILRNNSTNYHPFKGLVSHLDAAKRGLSEEFKNKVQGIQPGETRFYYCGGRAPIDYILLRRNTGNTVYVSYIDAKHSVDTDKSMTTEMMAVRDKAARIVHPALTTAMEELSLEVASQYTVTIVTDAEAPATVAGVSVICPSTFVFSPLTDVMYEVLLGEEEVSMIDKEDKIEEERDEPIDIPSSPSVTDDEGEEGEEEEEEEEEVQMKPI